MAATVQFVTVKFYPVTSLVGPRSYNICIENKYIKLLMQSFCEVVYKTTASESCDSTLPGAEGTDHIRDFLICAAALVGFLQSVATLTSENSHGEPPWQSPSIFHHWTNWLSSQ